MRTGGAIAMRAGVLAALGPPPTATAVPYSLTPTNGALVSQTAQTFSWLDNLAAGPIDHWYMEISTSPTVDYYYFGFFTGALAYASGDLTQASVNLNAQGAALAPGTYYWHVNGFYGAYGSLGTYWSGVQSFTIRDSSLPAPAIGVNPSSMYFAVNFGDLTVHGPQNLAVSNIGGGTLYVTTQVNSAPWISWGTGSNTGYVWTIPIYVRATYADGTTPWPIGVHTTNFALLDNGSTPPASNSPKYVPVTLQVFPVDSTGPTEPGIAINSGAPGTSSTPVPLSLAAGAAGSGMGQMCFNNEGGPWSEWVPYAATRTWHLPSGDGTKTVQVKYRDKVGNESAVASDAIVLDTVAPGAASLTAPAVSTATSKTTSFKLTFACGDADPSSGVGSYELMYRIAPSTTWLPSGTPTAGSSSTFAGKAGKTYQFQVRGIDGAGNAGEFSATKQTVVPFNETSARFAGAWKSKKQSSAFMGKVKATRSRGAAATLKATGTSFSVLVTKGPGRSKTKVYIDGKLARSVDTRAGSVKYRQLVAVKTFKKAGSHTVKVVNAATAGRPLLELDGIAVAQ